MCNWYLSAGARRTSPAHGVWAAPSAKGRWMVTVILPLTFVRMVYVRSSQAGTGEGEGGLPGPADWMGNNDPLFIASSIVPENPF